ncbi:primase-like protein [Spiroplasma clarkii]|uniref:Ribonuclease M5 n=1 Tax=Spiroplasma clarkii TaxID=2139 RepID=A0A1Y0KYR5_9MOLU|nr:ribonuclease M5 [Spiroplasma clarkii]ARU90884.1 primase-like protein [Spiroplasma clarkii]ATX71673.1 ribonuclease M5 [Spiroplasma clarkii]
MRIKQVIIVEGKTDTAKLQTVFGAENVQTFETSGLGLTPRALQTIAKLNQTQGVIVFTDPDAPGVKIRELINSYLDYKCFNAFIDKNKIINSKKIGIAEADETDIRQALEKLVEFKGKEINSISYEEFLDNDFYLKPVRQKIAQHFNWNEKINAKTLFKWLNLVNLTVVDVRKILGE